MSSHVTYPPLNVLKPVAEDVWIVDGPAIPFGAAFVKMDFPTRMTVLRLDRDRLFIHSPTPLTATLKDQIDGLGQPAWIIGPNRIHYWWIPEWHAAYPEALVHLAPRSREQAKGRIDFPARELDEPDGYPWDDTVATLPIHGSYMSEIVFFHRASRTLILTDLIENFEPEKLGLWARLLARFGGALDPDGSMPRDMRLTYGQDKEAFRHAVQTLIAWRPERIILAHGRWYEKNGEAELRRAFRWILP